MAKQGKPTRGAPKTSQEDWINTALDTLISEGVDSVKISVLSAKLNCARSSFYWYFKDRRDLLEVLLDQWQNRNTHAILERAGEPADSICFALTNLFSCWISPDGKTEKPFDTRLDFAVREWARRDGSVRRAVDISEELRINAIISMFERYGYEREEARIRARIVYYTQIGYEALDIRESNLDRAKAGRNYLLCLTGKTPTDAEIEAVVKLTGLSVQELKD